jgi:hypothetical protein
MGSEGAGVEESRRFRSSPQIVYPCDYFGTCHTQCSAGGARHGMCMFSLFGGGTRLTRRARVLRCALWTQTLRSVACRTRCHDMTPAPLHTTARACPPVASSTQHLACAAARRCAPSRMACPTKRAKTTKPSMARARLTVGGKV